MLKINNKKYYFLVIIEKDENGMFVGSVPELKSCYTQAKTLPELYKRLEEVVALCVRENKSIRRQTEFLGVQRLEFSVWLWLN